MSGKLLERRAERSGPKAYDHLLEVADSLDLGIAAGAGADATRLLEGMEATRRPLARAFEIMSGMVGTAIDPACLAALRVAVERLDEGVGQAA